MIQHDFLNNYQLSREKSLQLSGEKWLNDEAGDICAFLIVKSHEKLKTNNKMILPLFYILFYFFTWHVHYSLFWVSLIYTYRALH